MDERDASLREARRLEDSHGVGDPYAAAIRATRMPIAIADARQADNPIVFANDAFIELSGYTRAEVIGRNCRFLQGPDTDRTEVARIADAIRAGENVVTEILNYRKSGETFWNALYISPVFDDQGAITHFFGSQLDVTERRQAAIDLGAANARLVEATRLAESRVEERTRELQRALDQKTALLHEVDHRVKNNLQLIASLILLQSRRVKDGEARELLKATLERVSALAIVHRRPFHTEDVSAFDVAGFVRDLATDLVGADGREDVALDLDLEPVAIAPARAAPVSLIVNELLTNALKHAFPDRGGRIRIATRAEGDAFAIEVADDGVGRDETHDPVGFGQNLVELLCRQIGATIERVDAAPGVRIRVSAPVNTPQASNRPGPG